MNAACSPNLSSLLALLSMALLPPFALASPPAREAIDLPHLYISAQMSTTPARDSTPGLPPPTPGPSFVPNSCESSTLALCYDVGQRRAVYRPARAYMPGIEGFTAESVSLRHGVVSLRYSFR